MIYIFRTNLPKEAMGFPDFPIPAQKASYIPARDILNFLNLYADHFKLREHIKVYRFIIIIFKIILFAYH